MWGKMQKNSINPLHFVRIWQKNLTLDDFLDESPRKKVSDIYLASHQILIFVFCSELKTPLFLVR